MHFGKTLTENNLKLLNRTPLFERKELKIRDGKRAKHSFKSATPEALEKIRQKMTLDNARYRRKSVILGVICAMAFVAIIYFAMTM